MKTLLLTSTLVALLLASSCGGPVPQSNDLLGIDSSPQPVRDRALKAFLQPNVDPAHVQDLTEAIAAHEGVAAWQYDPAVTLAHVRRLSDEWNAGMIPLGVMPRLPSGSFIVVAEDEPAQSDLVDWLKTRTEVRSVAYWSGTAVTFTWDP